MTSVGRANPLIVALDVPDLDAAEALARALAGEVGCFKVGLELFSAHGPAAVRRIAAHGPVFLDVKLHDIPTTVRRAASAIAAVGPAMVSVHASGGAEMVTAAADGLAAGSAEADPPLLVAVTVLTSTSDADLAALGMAPVEQQVPRLAALAVDAGAGGLVCAPRDLPTLRPLVPERTVLIVPGVRPEGAATDDHARAATAFDALSAGADWLVVGRPIAAAPDPIAAARALLADAQR